MDVGDGYVSAERGYLRETGNLVFHLALVVLLVAVALGHLLGWRGDVVVPAGTTFSNTVSTYDTIDPGPWVDTENLPPFSVTVDKVAVRFETGATAARGAARLRRRRHHPRHPRRAPVAGDHPRQPPAARSTAPESTCSATVTRR